MLKKKKKSLLKSAPRGIKKYNKSVSKKHDKSKDEEENKNNQLWEFNHTKIVDAFHTILSQNKGKKPTIHEMMKATKLSLVTVFKHYKSMKFKPRQSEFRALTDRVYAAMYNHAIMGRASDRKLWFQIMEGWAEMHKHDIKAKGLEIKDDIDPKDARAVYLSKLED